MHADLFADSRMVDLEMPRVYRAALCLISRLPRQPSETCAVQNTKKHLFGATGIHIRVHLLQFRPGWGRTVCSCFETVLAEVTKTCERDSKLEFEFFFKRNPFSFFIHVVAGKEKEAPRRD